MIHPNNAVILPNYQVKKNWNKKTGEKVFRFAQSKNTLLTHSHPLSKIMAIGSAFTKPKRKTKTAWEKLHLKVAKTNNFSLYEQCALKMQKSAKK